MDNQLAGPCLCHRNSVLRGHSTDEVRGAIAFHYLSGLLIRGQVPLNPALAGLNVSQISLRAAGQQWPAGYLL